MEFKIGQKVQFKDWEEFKLAKGAITDMIHLCGTTAVIGDFTSGNKTVPLKDFSSNGDTDWRYTTNMIKPYEETIKEDNSVKQITITFNGDLTSASDGNKTVYVKRHGDDKYNEDTAIKEVLDKLKNEKNVYYTIDARGRIGQYHFCNDSFDKVCKSFGNYFKTRKDAVEALKEVKEVFKRYKKMNILNIEDEKLDEFLRGISNDIILDLDDTIKNTLCGCKKTKYRDGYIDGIKAVKLYINKTLGNSLEFAKGGDNE